MTKNKKEVIKKNQDRGKKKFKENIETKQQIR